VSLPQRVTKEFGISVHLRSIQRALTRAQKGVDHPCWIRCATSNSCSAHRSV
jgi:hypothetical protein